MTKPTRSKPKKKRILVVEDESVIGEMLSLVLQKAGYEVEVVEHAFAAICAMVRAGADLVLTDLRMPIIDGLGLVRELKSHKDTRHIPIIVVTGHDTPEYRAAALEAGCIGYITKPIEPGKFPEQIAKFLRAAK
jgi:CheY-like chemotaxis protein